MSRFGHKILDLSFSLFLYLLLFPSPSFSMYLTRACVLEKAFLVLFISLISRHNNLLTGSHLYFKKLNKKQKYNYHVLALSFYVLNRYKYNTVIRYRVMSIVIRYRYNSLFKYQISGIKYLNN